MGSSRAKVCDAVVLRACGQCVFFGHAGNKEMVHNDESLRMMWKRHAPVPGISRETTGDDGKGEKKGMR